MHAISDTSGSDQNTRLEVWQQVYERGTTLFRTGEPIASLYVVRSGAIKTFVQTEDGSEQIIGIHLPGDIVGLDAIASDTYTRSASAVDTASACAVPFNNIMDLCGRLPGLRNEMMRQMSQAIVENANLHVLLTTKNADQKLASFLVCLSDWHRKHGYSSSVFSLPMSRADIANFLNLKPETVSRALSKIQATGLVTVDRKQVSILDIEALRRAAGHVPQPARNSSTGV